MAKRTREQLLDRLNDAAEAGRGLRLSSGDVQLLLARPSAVEEVPAVKIVRNVPAEKLDAMDCQIRWLIRRDMEDVARIDNAAFYRPLVEEEYLSLLRKSNCVGIVAEYDHEVVGCIVYELNKESLRVHRLSVDPKHWRRGVGGQIILWMIDKLSQQRRRELHVDVPEDCLGAPEFFRAMGFRATGCVLNERGEPSYAMKFTLSEEAEV